MRLMLRRAAAHHRAGNRRLHTFFPFLKPLRRPFHELSLRRPFAHPIAFSLPPASSPCQPPSPTPTIFLHAQNGVSCTPKAKTTPPCTPRLVHHCSLPYFYTPGICVRRTPKSKTTPHAPHGWCIDVRYHNFYTPRIGVPSTPKSKTTPHAPHGWSTAACNTTF